MVVALLFAQGLLLHLHNLEAFLLVLPVIHGSPLELFLTDAEFINDRN